MSPSGQPASRPPDPLRRLHLQAEASFVSLVAPRADGRTDGAPTSVEVVETYGDAEGEYEAIRHGCALLDMPQRSTLQVIGKDRAAFLNRMLTQDFSPKGLGALGATRSFWLNRKGRVEADVRVIALEDRWLIDVDARAARSVVESLTKFVFTEDVEIVDATARWRRLALHGPRARERLAALCGSDGAARIQPLEPGRVAQVGVRTGAGVVECVVDRQDSAGVCGLEALAPSEVAPAVWEALLESGVGQGVGVEGAVHPVGWAAYDTARIEAGWAVFLIDFGQENLPHETGVLRDRVSFTKGCYLGQEIVARMESLGQPKQMLAGLRIEGDPRLAPARGAAVFVEGESDAVGAVTSATRSPALGGAPVCFAMVKTKHASAGARLTIGEGEQRASALVQEKLRFLSDTTPGAA